jgi:hypothetical protein
MSERSSGMDFRKIIFSGIAGGVVLFITMFVFDWIAALVAPYDIMSIAGMRATDDPVMILFFLSPFVFSFAAAIVFDTVHGSLPSEPIRKGICFGLLLFLIYAIPSIFIVFTSMVYPAGFFIGQFLTGILAYPLMGVTFAIIWVR